MRVGQCLLIGNNLIQGYDNLIFRKMGGGSQVMFRFILNIFNVFVVFKKGF